MAADSGGASARFHLAYALLAAGETTEAITTFRAGLSRDSSFRDGWRQLGYVYRAQGKADSAFVAFLAAQRLAPLTARDWIEVGYAQGARGNKQAARDAFSTALRSEDTAAVALARRAMNDSASVVATASVARSLFFEAYAAPLYQTRFDNAIGQGFVRGGWSTPDPHGVVPYLSLRLTRDSRSVGGTRPEIFSDNSVLPAIGVRIQPRASSPTFYAEGGPAVLLLDDGKGSRVRPDVRTGAYYATGWYQGSALRTEVYIDASYYSRFERDIITYFQVREVLDAVAWSTARLELYVRVGGVADSRRVSYNNALEFAPGVAFVPGATRRVVLSVEQVTGGYLVDAFAGAKRRYSDVRAMAVFYAIGRAATSRP